MSDLNTQFVDKIRYFDIPVVESHEPVTDPHSFVNMVRALKGMEGFIIAWDYGYRVKIKAEEYVRFHKTKDGLTLEKNVVELIVNEKMDDAKAFMIDEDRHRVEQFEALFWEGVAANVALYNTLFNVRLAGMDRKQFAVELMPHFKAKDPHASQIMFGLYDGKDTRKMILDIIAKNTGTQTKIDSVRALWGDAKWNYHFEGDA